MQIVRQTCMAFLKCFTRIHAEFSAQIKSGTQLLTHFITDINI